MKVSNKKIYIHYVALLRLSCLIRYSSEVNAWQHHDGSVRGSDESTGRQSPQCGSRSGSIQWYDIPARTLQETWNNGRPRQGLHSYCYSESHRLNDYYSFMYYKRCMNETENLNFIYKENFNDWVCTELSSSEWKWRIWLFMSLQLFENSISIYINWIDKENTTETRISRMTS